MTTRHPFTLEEERQAYADEIEHLKTSLSCSETIRKQQAEELTELRAKLAKCREFFDSLSRFPHSLKVLGQVNHFQAAKEACQ